MKKIYNIVIALFISAIVFAQAPQKMSYQAVIRDASNNLISNHIIGMKISIIKDSVTGKIVYSEIQNPTTNTNGLVSIEFGGKAGFSSIDWSQSLYYVQTETDPTGGTNYTITGTSQMLSVPYALYAEKSGNYTSLSNTMDIFTTKYHNLFSNEASGNLQGYALNNKGFVEKFTADTRFVSDYIPVEYGRTYAMSNMVQSNCSYYDANHKFISVVSPTTINNVKYFASSKDSSVAFIRLNIVGSPAGIASKTDLVFADSTVYDGKDWKYQQQTILPSLIDNTKVKTSLLDNDAQFITSKDLSNISKLKGKKIYCLGDSITEIGNVTGALSNQGLIVTNYGIGGSRLSDVDSLQTKAMCNRVSTMSSTAPDIILVMGGTNDCYVSKLGKVTDTTKTTVAGAVYNIFNQLQTKYPNSYILFASMPRRMDNRFDDYANIVINTCAYLDIPCVDLFHNTGYNELNYKNYVPDLIHPNKLGGERIAAQIISKLESIVY